MKYIIILLLVFPVSFALAEEPEALIDRFFEKMSEEKYEEAVDLLTEKMNEGLRKSNISIKLKSHLRTFPDAIGEYHRGELISKKELGSSFVAIACLALYEREAMRLEFVFYRPDAEWVLFKLNMTDFDADDMIELLREEDGYKHKKKEKP